MPGRVGDTSGARQPYTGCDLFEHLEPRVLLANNIALVGLAAETGASLISFVAEAIIDDNGVITAGALNGPGSTGPGPDLEVPWSAFNFRVPSAFDLSYIPAVEPFDNEFGAQFLNEEYSAGWFVGYDDQQTITDWSFSAIIEQPDDADLSDIAGVWSMSMYQFSTTGIVGSGFNGTVSIGGASIVLFLTSISGVPPILGSQAITASSSDGVYVTSVGTVWYINLDRSIIIMADLSTQDGKLSIGIGIRPDVNASNASVAGDYRLSMIPDLAFVAAGLDPISETILRLGADGTFKFFDVTQYDSGQLVPDDEGTYTIVGSAITLSMDDGSTFTLEISENQRTLIPKSARVVDVSDQTFDVVGLGTKIAEGGTGISPRADLIAAIGQIRSTGPVVYELRTDDKWHEIDLIGITGVGIKPADVTHIETFIDRVTDRQMVSVIADGTLYIFSRGLGGVWINTTSSFDLGSAELVSNFTIFHDLGADLDGVEDDLAIIAAIDVTGDMVFFQQTGQIGLDSQSVWKFVNITDTQLKPNGFTTPTFSADIASYVQPWNGQNVVGLDLLGNVWSIWFAPGLASWRSVNLSFITGAPRMVGKIAPYVQSWGGTNLVGLDTAGHVQVTWWVPSFGGDWITTDFTAVFNGPTFAINSITSWVFSWGGSNVGGLDADGEVVFFWWAPGIVPDQWRVADMTAPLPPTDPRPIGELGSFVTDDDQANVFGTAPSGDLLRFSWDPTQTDWTLENVTELAV